MAIHPQNSPRGLFAKGAILMGSTGLYSSNYSEGTAVLASNTTGVLDIPVSLSFASASITLGYNSTGLTIAVGTGSGAQISTA